MRKYQLLIASLLFASSFTFAQNVTDNVVSAFQNGNAAQLANYFNSNVELIYDGPGKIYNKSQAQMIMKDFFNDNVPNEFTRIHEGDKDSSIFLIGNLSTSGSRFRVSILMKKSGNSFLIHQIRIQDA